MAEGPVDPSSLEGDALRRWYQRTPADIDRERQAVDAQRYKDFFGGLRTASPATQPPSTDAATSAWPGIDYKVGALPGQDRNAVFDTIGAGAGDEHQLLLVGNPAHPRLRREWERKWGQDWPRDPVTGRNYDVAHINAKADLGKDHVDNIRPMHPDAHRAEHLANGDFGRWARRQWIARAFGGTVVRSIEPLSVLSGILGMFSGRIRTDSFDNFSSDMIGLPSQTDRQKAAEDLQRIINPNWKSGDPFVT